MGIASILFAVGFVLSGTLAGLLLMYGGHTHEEPRIVRLTVPEPERDQPIIDDMPLPVSPRSYEDQKTAALDRAPFPAYFNRIKRGEWT